MTLERVPQSRRRRLVLLLNGAGVGLTIATLGGFLGTALPGLDIFAHFRVHYTLAALVLVAVALRTRARKTAAGILVVLAINAATLAPYVSVMPAQARTPALTLVALNLRIDNPETDRVLAFLRRENADVVVLSEISPHWEEALKSLADVYPHRVDKLDCRPRINCSVLMLAKAPWQDAGVLRAEDAPPLVWARVARNGRDVTVIGTHLMWPFAPRLQARQVETLAAFVRRLDTPVVVAGDLNLTPWSALFARLESQAKLRRAKGGIVQTWPAGLVPFGIPIDHALTDLPPDAVALRAGPDVGSDHLPIIVDLRL
ncbi:MAG: endonuclease/exonuclease/phosphatase family protein [Pseudomonadota bacterium]